MKTEQELKILILYASYGDGHVQVSKALRDCFEERGAGHVRLVDLYALAHPLTDAVARYVYLISCTFCPRLYGWSYYLTQNMQFDRLPAKLLNYFGAAALKDIIMTEKPDAVINTFPMPVIPGLRRPGGQQIPVFTVITDFVLHGRWIHRDVDRYFVANEELKTAVIDKGIPGERVIVSGIPIRKAFCQPCDNNRLTVAHGRDPSKKTVLIMAGAYGVLRSLKKVCRALLRLKGVQVLLVCGKNKPLKEKIEAGFANEPDIRIYGFVENIEELMAVSSCIITKAGGITLSEALSRELPVIVFRPLPGQEKENALYLAKKGAAMIACRVEELVQNVGLVLYNKQHAMKMKEAIKALRKNNAARTVVSGVLNRLAVVGKKTGQERDHNEEYLEEKAESKI